VNASCGWSKGLELAKLARSRNGQGFDRATWLHKAKEFLKEQFQREVEKELTGTLNPLLSLSPMPLPNGPNTGAGHAESGGGGTGRAKRIFEEPRQHRGSRPMDKSKGNRRMKTGPTARNQARHGGIMFLAELDQLRPVICPSKNAKPTATFGELPTRQNPGKHAFRGGLSN
jgi:hypothetical protein